MDELEHTLIHYLCVGSMTHSKILELIRSEGKQEATVDEILKKIADYNSCTKEPTKKVYKLKKGRTEIWNNNNKTSVNILGIILNWKFEI